MAEDTPCVSTNEDGSITINESGYITPENISKLRFSFSGPDDITESLHKKSSKRRDDVSVTKKGKTAYGAMKCTYPDKTESSMIILTKCILQYRENIEREDSDYGTGYVCIGLPLVYIGKIRSDASKNSGIKANVKDNVKMLENHMWVNCSLEKLNEDSIWIVYESPEGEGEGKNVDIRTLLSHMKQSMECIMLTTCSVTQTTDKMEDDLDLKNGQYHFTFKPAEIFFKGVSDLVGPVLEDTNRRKKESASKGAMLVASQRLADFAARHL